MLRKAAIVILDGWGIGRHDKSDAVWNADTPFTDSLTETCPMSSLRTDGENVGLPEGQMGNSEVGHMNIGAGRIVWQMLVRINKAFEHGEIAKNPVWCKALDEVTEGKSLHLIGLVSDGGVHSHIRHLEGLSKSAAEKGISRIYIHAFLDGRDTDPKSGLGYISDLIVNTQGTGAVISTIVGRYFAYGPERRRLLPDQLSLEHELAELLQRRPEFAHDACPPLPSYRQPSCRPRELSRRPPQVTPPRRVGAFADAHLRSGSVRRGAS